MTAFMHWVEQRHGLDFGGSYALSGAWSVDEPGGLLAARSGTTSSRRRRRSLDRPLEPRDARSRVVPGQLGSTTPSTCCGSARTPIPRSRTSPRAARSARSAAASSARGSPRWRKGCARLGVEKGDRVCAYIPNSPGAIIGFLATASIGAIWSSCSPDFGAGVGRRPLRPDRAQGPDRRRRLPLRRQGLRPDGDRRRARARDADTRAHDPDRLPRSRRRRRRGSSRACAGATSRPRAQGTELSFERGALRPPPLGPLLLRHHRTAEGDRPGPRRHPARAPEEDAPPRRRAGGRPRLLVHDDGLDDVELPRLRPAHPGLDRPLRRQPRLPEHGRPLGPRRAGADHHLRDLSQLHLRPA